MPVKLPPLNWLRTFEVAARELNFTVAARELNMTQSAVSQQIRLLEDNLGGTVVQPDAPADQPDQTGPGLSAGGTGGAAGIAAGYLGYFLAA